MTGWLTIIIVAVFVWGWWLMLNLVADVFQIWYAARRGEDVQTRKGKGSSL